ncbi:hypothetical protein Mpt1_c01440 [Candidatus Methanoplasma termitum]|uniref:Uncharacterized protein n=1 Tax=Candidatus Methanoplasma termitum TaxID=1577791 RepID=A0A0A7LCN4_9ARCH|nr:hypothetical protein [Candidatus Methanoplasma termitum]AIZ56047.1 hypothetical protein Mpt1_c01440 [Candidatus Methanoplasma termitum]MCL2333584.1 hypothetical protein [Candidatus Methanoplasma sp.]
MVTPTIDDLAMRVEALEKALSVEPANIGASSRTLYAASVLTPDAKAVLEKRINDLELAKSKVSNAFTSEDISNYLGTVIDKFNSKASGGDSSVAYMVSNVDLELKAQVVREGNDFKFMSADPETRSVESMSTIKISVRAVPK